MASREQTRRVDSAVKYMVAVEEHHLAGALETSEPNCPSTTSRIRATELHMHNAFTEKKEGRRERERERPREREREKETKSSGTKKKQKQERQRQRERERERD